MKRLIASLILAALATANVVAAPVKFDIDPAHTYPAFEADHFGGLSIWRGKINRTSGTIALDTAAGTGTVDVTMQMDSIDYGFDKLNEHARSAEIFDVARYPTATFKGTLAEFKNGSPSRVAGTLTLHGVSKPVDLQIRQFKCMDNPMTRQYTCGADAYAVINRSDFGVDYGAGYGFNQEVTLRISVEAIKTN